MRTKVATYLMKYEDLEKIVPEEYAVLQKKLDDCLILLRLRGCDVDLKDVILYVQNADGKLYDDFLEEDEVFRDEIDEIASSIVGSKLTDLKNAFEEKTELDMWINWSELSSCLYVDFPENETVILSPETKKLEDLGVGFMLEEYI